MLFYPKSPLYNLLYINQILKKSLDLVLYLSFKIGFNLFKITIFVF